VLSERRPAGNNDLVCAGGKMPPISVRKAHAFRRCAMPGKESSYGYAI
jgi:hypothetical protein